MRTNATRILKLAALIGALAFQAPTRDALAAEPDTQPGSTAPVAAPPPAPQGLLPIPDYTGSLWTRTHLASDFNGGRTALAEKGITIDVDWTQYLQGIAIGGLDRTTDYGGHLDYLIHLDLMRMNVLPGALVTIRAESRYGTSVNGQSGQILPVNTAAFFPLTKNLDDPVPITITDLNYTQFLSDKLAITLGKIDTLDADLNEFASGRGKSQFMDANFLFDSATGLRLPYSTLGAAVLIMPTPNISVTSSIINTVDSSTTSGFTDFGDGMTWSTEADFQYRILHLPGGANVGGLYSFDQNFSKLGGRLIFQPGHGLLIPKKDDTWAVYASAWQYLLVKDPSDRKIDTADGVPDHEGLGLFARLGFADQDTNPIKWSGSFGLGGRGLIPTRKNDVFGVGYFYTRFQETRLAGFIGASNNGQGAEAFYNLALTPAAHLTFDVQVQDTALPHVDNGVILGMRLNLSF